MKRTRRLTLIAMLLGPALSSSAAAASFSLPAHAVVASIAAQVNEAALENRTPYSFTSTSPHWLRKGVQSGLRTTWTHKGIRTGVAKGIRNSSRPSQAMRRF